MTLRHALGSTKIPLSRIAAIPPRQYASTSIENDTADVLERYVPSTDTVDAIRRFSAGLAGSKGGRMISITGPYGSGKSTMGIFLNCLASPEDGSEWKVAFETLRRASPKTANHLERIRKTAGIAENGMVRCLATAKREPVAVTVLRALHNGAQAYFGRYGRRDFAGATLLRLYLRELKKGTVPDTDGIIEIISGIAAVSPVLIMIDEFGKNIEYFTADGGDDGDLFLLQELAEMSGVTRRLPLHIITMQHMSFEEYAVGAPAERRKEWAKIQGRFDDVPFGNTPEHVRELVSRTIKTVDREAVTKWAKRTVGEMQDAVGIRPDADITASCYPLHPLVLEALPELCARYGQNERTLLSFMSGGGTHTVARFIDENVAVDGGLPSIGLDILYDYFITGYIGSGASRLMEIGTIIRDAHGLDDVESMVLKTIGVLNLIGRSGPLRASRSVVEYAVGPGARLAIRSLKRRSIITYRRHADEYRVWHGTDINIAAGLNLRRRRYGGADLNHILARVVTPDAVVATKHSIDTGTMRRFNSVFGCGDEISVDDGFDGVIVYGADRSRPPACGKPVIMVDGRNLDELRRTAVDVAATRDFLESGDEIVHDWVARNELKEMLADAETRLDGAFDSAYGTGAEWYRITNGRSKRLKGPAVLMVSQVCDEAYSMAPVIQNEMINRHEITAQAATARNRLMCAIIENSDKSNLGITGSGPEHAVYVAMLREWGIHRSVRNGYALKMPTDGTAVPVWEAVLDALNGMDEHVNLNDVYHTCMMPPFGMKGGVLPIFVVLILAVHSDNIAVYEHGTYVPYLSADLAERLAKNPKNFDLKYFHDTPSRKRLVGAVAERLGLRQNASMLDVVGRLVSTVRRLPEYTRNTKSLATDTLNVRSAIMEAREPDTLLFISIPEALRTGQLGLWIWKKKMDVFIEKLAISVSELDGAFDSMVKRLEVMLLESTGTDSRERLAEMASVILPSVSEQRMKVFLGAVAADIPDNENWIKYVALTLTDVPPTSWKDEDRATFDNSLLDLSDRFRRLVQLNFSKLSGGLADSYQITVTRTDGSEKYRLVTPNSQRGRRVTQMADKIISEMEGKLDEMEDLVTELEARIAEAEDG